MTQTADRSSITGGRHLDRTAGPSETSGILLMVALLVLLGLLSLLMT